MTPSSRSTNQGAVAGMYLISCIVLGTLVGLGVGALVELAFPLALLGLFAGAVLGFLFVRSRFRHL